MDVASDDVVYTKRGGLFKERGTELPLRPNADDSDTDEEDAEQIELLRKRVHAASSRKGGSRNDILTSTARKRSEKSKKSKKDRKPSKKSETSEVSPMRKMLQREAELTELNDSDLYKRKGETKMTRRMRSATSASPMTSSVASSVPFAQQQKPNNTHFESDASSVSMSESSMPTFLSAGSLNLTQEQQDRRERNRKVAATSKKNTTKTARSSSSPPPPPPQTTSLYANKTSNSAVTQSLREKRKSLLNLIAASKTEAPKPEVESHNPNNNKNNNDNKNNHSSSKMSNANRELIDSALKRSSRHVNSASEDEGDASLRRYLDRAVRLIGEKNQFRNMKILPTDRHEEIGIAIAESGIGAQEPLTVSDLFEKAVSSCGANIAMQSRSEGWRGWTWQDYYFDVIKAAKAFINLGVQRWDSVLMAGSNSPEQAIAYFGAIFAGALPTFLFPTDGSEVYVDVTVRLGGVMVMVENARELDKFMTEESIEKLASVECFVMWRTPPEHTPNRISKFDIPVYHWEEFLALGAQISNLDLEVRLDAQRTGHACSIAVGAGGRGFSSPKLVLLTHDNLTWQAFAFTKGAAENLDWGDTRGGERTLSILPLANVATLVLDLYVPLTLAGMFERSQILHFAAPKVGESVADCISAVRPTALFANPQVYDALNDVLLRESKSGIIDNEKVLSSTTDELFPDNENVSSRQSINSVKSMSSMQSGRSGQSIRPRMSSIKAMLTGSRNRVKTNASRATSGRFSGLLKSRSSGHFDTNSTRPALDQRRSANEMSGGSGGGAKKRIGSGVLQSIADVLVFRNHKDRLGLSQCKMLMNHGETLPNNILNTFTSNNMHIVEAYGMVEASGLVSLSWPTAWHDGAVGVVHDSVELQCINSKSGKRLRAGVEGELVLRGRCVAMGYLDNLCRNESTISVDGFLRTGDVGSVNCDGYLCLLGRMANRIMLSGTTKYIFPVPIERVLMSKLPMVQHLILIGNQTHKHLTLLITLAQSGVLQENDEETTTDGSERYSTDGESEQFSLRKRLHKRASSSSNLLTTPSQRSLQRQASRREQNLAQHAVQPRQTHRKLNRQHRHHPQFKQTPHETNAILAPRACINGVTTVGQAKLNSTYMGHIQNGINWYNESELCTDDSRKILGFTIIEKAFCADGERPELSANMMVNRSAVCEKYRNIVKQMYLPGFDSLKQASYFGLNQATMAGKFDKTLGKFVLPTKKLNNAAQSGVKVSVKSETQTDLTNVH